MSCRPVVFFLLAALTACGSGDPAVPADGEALPATAGSVAVTPGGNRIDLEVASTPGTRARGLMFRDTLPRGRGMLFIFPSEEIQGFWMKNTLISLDLLWLDSTGRIVHIERSVPPCEADPCPTYTAPAPARYVLEIAGGEAEFHALGPGQVLRIEGVEGYRVE